MITGEFGSPSEHLGGEPWQPTDEHLSPHTYDYKCLLVRDSDQETVRQAISQEVESPGSSGLDLRLEWLEQRIAFRKYLESATKRGFFVIAGCVITDGFGRPGAEFDHMLVIDRSKEQFHRGGGERFTSGQSIVAGTTFASFKIQDNFGHVPTVLFNDIRAFCPWALFSRKLIVPDVQVQSRFLGLGFNFAAREKEGREYLFLVWHVRTRSRPEVMQVASRLVKQSHDRCEWLPKSRLAGVRERMTGPVDRSTLVAIMEGTMDRAYGSSGAGFVPIRSFEAVKRSRWVFHPVKRDEIILDVLRVIQARLHNGQVELAAKSGELQERDLQNWLATEIEGRLKDCRIQFDMSQEWLPGVTSHGKGQGRVDIEVMIRDAEARALFFYVIEVKLDTVSSPRDEAVAQLARYTRAAAAAGHPPAAGILIHGVRTAEAIDPSGWEDEVTFVDKKFPIHIFRLAVSPAPPSASLPLKEVVHALIPFRRGTRVEGLLFTRQGGDPGFQPIGGKVERGESRVNALKREMTEETRCLGPELTLFPSDILELREVREGGFPLEADSPTTGTRTLYRFHPFVVFLTEAARERIRTVVASKDDRFSVVPLKSWSQGRHSGDTGPKKRKYDPAYAKAVLAEVEGVGWEEAAIEIGPP